MPVFPTISDTQSIRVLSRWCWWRQMKQLDRVVCSAKYQISEEIIWEKQKVSTNYQSITSNPRNDQQTITECWPLRGDLAPTWSSCSSPTTWESWAGRSTSWASDRIRAEDLGEGTVEGDHHQQARTPGGCGAGKIELVEGVLEDEELSDYHHQDFGDQSTTPRPLLSRPPANL